MIRVRTLCGNREIYRNGAAERSGTHGPRGNILLRLPHDDLIGTAAIARSRDDFAYA